MKRLIRSKNAISILDGINEVDVIVIVNDARSQTLISLPVRASSDYDEDYDQFTVEELMELDDSVLRNIDSFYALDNLNTAISEYGFDYKLTNKQKTALSNYYEKRELSRIDVMPGEIEKLLNLIKDCNHITGPDYRRGQPENNFADIYGLDMTPSDYMAIIKSITPDEFHSAIKSVDTKRLGSILYEFIHDPKGYVLKYSGQQIDTNIKIYIKLLPDYERDCSITIVSFHDPEGIQ